MTDQPKLPPGSPCTNCGKCCTNRSFMGSMSATIEDVERWGREGRDDILAYEDGGDLWIKDGEELYRCPFVRKVRGQNRYLYTIYETRPQVCRDYTPWAPGTICEVV
jgi:Fe-S-cluster containining protein